MTMRIDEHQLKRTLYRDNQTVSKNIRLLRILHGYKQQDMADLLHMSRSAYFSMENGGKTPDFEMLSMLADFYNINPDYLISFDISQQMINMINVDKDETNALVFIRKFMELSRSGKTLIKEELDKLTEIEKGFIRFPWKYDGYDKYDVHGALEGKRKLYERGR